MDWSKSFDKLDHNIIMSNLNNFAVILRIECIAFNVMVSSLLISLLHEVSHSGLFWDLSSLICVFAFRFFSLVYDIWQSIMSRNTYNLPDITNVKHSLSFYFDAICYVWIFSRLAILQKIISEDSGRLQKSSCSLYNSFIYLPIILKATWLYVIGG